MKEEGLAVAVGRAAGNIEIMMPMLRDWHLDGLITHNRYTLVNRNAEPLPALAQSKGMFVLNAAPYVSRTLFRRSRKLLIDDLKTSGISEVVDLSSRGMAGKQAGRAWEMSSAELPCRTKRPCMRRK